MSGRSADLSPASTRPRSGPSADDVAAFHVSLDPEDTAFEVARVLLAMAGATACGVWGVGAGRRVAILGALAPEDGAIRADGGFRGTSAPVDDDVAEAAREGRATWAGDTAGRSLVPGQPEGRVLLLPLGRGPRAPVAALAPVHPAVVGGLEVAAEHAGAALGNALAFARRGAALETALAHERDRMAADLHDTAGQLFVAIQLLARREAEKLPAHSDTAARFHRLADLADQGKREIAHAIDALAFFTAARHGVLPAIRSLASSFRSDSELDVIVDVAGRPARLASRTERALYRVVHESLANAWRHARCSVVRIALSFEGAAVHLTVTDDGTGLTETIPDRGRVGTSSMRRAITGVGGTFQIRNASPRGVVVEATVPRAAR